MSEWASPDCSTARISRGCGPPRPSPALAVPVCPLRHALPTLEAALNAGHVAQAQLRCFLLFGAATACHELRTEFPALFKRVGSPQQGVNQAGEAEPESGDETDQGDVLDASESFHPIFESARAMLSSAEVRIDGTFKGIHVIIENRHRPDQQVVNAGLHRRGWFGIGTGFRETARGSGFGVHRLCLVVCLIIGAGPP